MERQIFEFNYDNQDIADNPQAKEVFDQLDKNFEDGSITLDDYKQAREYDLIKVLKPTLAQKSYIFCRNFKIGYYFVRYLMWNF